MTYLSYSCTFVPFNPSKSIFKLENETFLLFFSKLLSWISTPLMWLVLTQLSDVKNFVLPLNLCSCVSFIKPHRLPLPDLQQSLPAPPALGNPTLAAGELQGVMISESSSTLVFQIPLKIRLPCPSPHFYCQRAPSRTPLPGWGTSDGWTL